MSQPIRIENDCIRLEVWPTLGGKISSVVDKADNFELLFNYPAELPTAPQYDLPYANSWYAGWDECFPAVSASKYTGHPYDGIAVPDHGELWGLPTTAVPTKDGITTVWNGLRFGYRLTRKLYINDATLSAEYTLINLAPFEFRYVWAAHGLMTSTIPVEIELAHAPLFRLNHIHDGTEINQTFEWPMLPDGDASKLAGLPTRRGWKVFSTEPIESEVTVRYPTRGRTVQIAYDTEDDQPAFWGIWINNGGWNNHRHFAIEPTTGRFDELDRSIKDGSAGRVEPMGRREWSVRWVLA